MTQSLPLAIPCGNYDRTRPLFDGQVLIEGCPPISLPRAPEEIFFRRAFVHEEFDVSELSLSGYTMRRAKGDCPYVGIPVFIPRTYRHSAIYVRTDRGINRPEDLRRRLVGVPEYQQTAAVWIRGMLQDDYGARSVPTPADPGRAVRPAPPRSGRSKSP
jgi:4,5-dihydroxyphthalate decarboxylase